MEFGFYMESDIFVSLKAYSYTKLRSEAVLTNVSVNVFIDFSGFDYNGRANPRATARSVNCEQPLSRRPQSHLRSQVRDIYSDWQQCRLMFM